MSNEKMRESFEEWYSPIFHGGEKANMPIRSNGEYRSVQTQIAWMAWQAATAAIQRDAMAVAETVRDACSKLAMDSPIAADTLNSDGRGTAWKASTDIRRIDLTAIVEAVQPASVQQQGAPVAYLIDWPDEPELGHYFAEEPTDTGRCRALYTTPPSPACSVPDGKQHVGTKPVKGDYFLCQCEKCGWLGSSEETRADIDPLYGDGDYFCPVCDAIEPEEVDSAAKAFNAMLAAAPKPEGGAR